MGGCKCTFRNCTIKSDGQTHMFHYPVFDKVRCHHWLTNAQRLDFLDLKVSQLRNRVVCQHHFLPDNFMNYKMDKLRFDAVPTENGPFCDDSDWPKNNLTQETDNRIFSITAEDIEVDKLTLKEKKASFSVKYGDFLINSETDTPHLLPDTKNTILPFRSMKQKIKKNTSIDASKSDFQLFPDQHVNRVSLPPEPKKHQSQPMLVVQPYFDYKNKILYENTNQIEASEREIKPVLSDSNVPLGNKRRNNKINIISEKKISKPLTVKGELKPVLPTMIICGSDTKKNIVQKERDNINNIENMEVVITNPSENSHTLIGSQVTYEPVLLESQNNKEILLDNLNQSFEPYNIVESIRITDHQELPSCSSLQIQPLVEDNKTEIAVSAPLETYNQEEIPRKSPQKVSILKTQIPPERVAEIQEKRKFNKKLRDMIEFCLDELDDPEKLNNESNKLQNTGVTQSPQKSNKVNLEKVSRSVTPQTKVTMLDQKHMETVKNTSQSDTKKHNESLSVTTFLSKEPELPSVSEYNIASLEARLKKMEDNLLRKIDQNAQRIYDLNLKHAVVASPTERRSVVTQTNDDEETHKKQLFQEMSRYLSPELNSLIYEELFLSKYAKETSIKPDLTNYKAKRLKRRR